MDCRFIAVLGCLALAPACFSEPLSPEQTTEGTSGTTEASSTLDEASTSVGDASSSTSVGSTTTPTGGSTEGSSTSQMECESQVYDVGGRTAPLGLLLVLDSSQSMQDQVPTVQEVLDDLSTEVITNLDGDTVRVLIATGEGNPNDWCLGVASPAGPCGAPGVEVAELDIDFSGDGADPFGLLVAALAKNPAGILRPVSQKHVVLVTDGDIGDGPQQDLAQLRLQPGFLHTRVHTLAGGAQSEGCLGEAPNAGALSMQTGGVSSSLCLGDAGPLFDALLTPIAACTFPLPEGAELDLITSAVLVEGPSEQDIDIVDAIAGCLEPGAAAILSVDGEPPAVSLCPDTCRTYQDAATEAERTSLRVLYESCE